MLVLYIRDILIYRVYIAEKCDFCTFVRIQFKTEGFPVQNGFQVLHLVSDFCTVSPSDSRLFSVPSTPAVSTPQYLGGVESCGGAGLFISKRNYKLIFYIGIRCHRGWLLYSSRPHPKYLDLQQPVLIYFYIFCRTY